MPEITEAEFTEGLINNGGPQQFPELNEQEKLRKQITTVVNTMEREVGQTLGPHGRFVIYNKSMAGHTITKDGKTVSQYVPYKSKGDAMIATFVREVLSKTVEQAGDGTTTATVILKTLWDAYLSAFKDEQPTELISQVKLDMEDICSIIDQMALPMNQSEVKKLAKVSCDGDEEMATIIEKAYSFAGPEGTISYDLSHDEETFYETISGMRSNMGAKIKGMTGQSGEWTKHNPIILMINSRITTIDARILDVIKFAGTQRRPLIVMCKDIDTTVHNNIQQMLRQIAEEENRNTGAYRIIEIMFTNLPEAGKSRKYFMEDLAVATGGKYLDPDDGLGINNLSKAEVLQACGELSQVTVTDNETRFYFKEHESLTRAIEDHVKAIKSNESVPEHVASYRVNRLAGKIVKVLTGGANTFLADEKNDRMDDGVKAVRSAFRHGYLPGAGLGLINAVKVLYQQRYESADIDDEQIHLLEMWKLVAFAGLRRILINEKGTGDSALSEITKVINTVHHSDDENLGYNARSREISDLIEDGIIDSAGVVKSSLRNAVEIFTILVRTGSVLS